MTATLRFHDDPSAFLADAGAHLARDPVLSTVVATVAEREVRRGRLVPDGLPHWYVVVRSADGAVVGAAMRTAPFEPYPAFVLPMPAGAAVALARVLHERGERLGAVNGALPAAQVLAEETCRLAGGGSARVERHTRLFQLHTVRRPPAPAGVLRPATERDTDLALAWFHAFGREADEQAGRPAGTDETAGTDRDDILGRVQDGRLFVWEVDGETVHLTGCNPPAYGAARIGPVFTPGEHRGRGYARAAVAEVSQRILDRGARPCLFTDQANPVSNRIYTAIGYEPVVDMANLLVG
jgi:predicted GNAT family acetyltransferase